jgi:hypothetical protein
MTYKNTRPESPKGQTFIAFEVGGVSGARKKGNELHIPESKVERWLNEWSGSAVPTRTRADNEIEVVKDDGVTLRNGARVCYVKDDPNFQGTLIAVGPEQCEVRWDNGVRQAEITSWLRRVEKKPAVEKRTRREFKYQSTARHRENWI